MQKLGLFKKQIIRNKKIGLIFLHSSVHSGQRGGKVIPLYRERKIRIALWAISTTFWNFQYFSPTCFACNGDKRGKFQLLTRQLFWFFFPSIYFFMRLLKKKINFIFSTPNTGFLSLCISSPVWTEQVRSGHTGPF